MNSVLRFSLDRRIFWLLVFSFTDAACTHMGIRLQLVEELNPLIRHVYNWNVTGYYAYKLLFPLLLALLFPYVRERRWFDVSLSMTFWLYLAVNVYHVAWIVFCCIQGYL
ncbi:DUF5658 family protein [Paenibacillus hexagrammi]|uniref:DUF5658 family protein n=1 Tax=Paenibacillus hexagrammi TaxID=2908839 RepID=A0ABY3SBP3_9BACL|nr:DUF5658 family protein [Paenibacillus sp. YPD9-1]UJF31343.1 DUF5658 family protein [Paenibacillus sp. YPD9-1]